MSTSFFNSMSFLAIAIESLDLDRFSDTFPLMLSIFCMIDSKLSYLSNNETAVFGPTLSTPGMLSDASPTKTFIIEDYLECKGFASDTDCFSVNGSLDFITFSNQRFDSKSPNPYAPSGFTWPSKMSEENQNYLKKELKRLISLLDMKSSIYNIEVRLATNDKPYISFWKKGWEDDRAITVSH